MPTTTPPQACLSQTDVVSSHPGSQSLGRRAPALCNVLLPPQCWVPAGTHMREHPKDSLHLDSVMVTPLSPMGKTGTKGPIHGPLGTLVCV